MSSQACRCSDDPARRSDRTQVSGGEGIFYIRGSCAWCRCRRGVGCGTDTCVLAGLLHVLMESIPWPETLGLDTAVVVRGSWVAITVDGRRTSDGLWRVACSCTYRNPWLPSRAHPLWFGVV